MSKPQSSRLRFDIFLDSPSKLNLIEVRNKNPDISQPSGLLGSELLHILLRNVSATHSSIAELNII